MARLNRRFGLISGSVVAMLLLAASTSNAAPGLRITFPPEGTVVFPAQTVSILVGADPSIQDLGVLTETPLPNAKVGSSANEFQVVIPANLAPGRYRLTAFGSASGGLVKSESVELDVERADEPTQIRVEPAILRFQSGGESIPLRVLGTFGDGSHATLTASSRTTYVSQNPAVATVSARGIVTAVGTGTTNVEIHALTASYTIQVKVQAAAATSLLLDNGRFKVDVRWTTTTGSGDGMPVQLTSDTGYFWFFNPANVEMVVKVLNGCGLGGHYWVFAGGLTNVQTVAVVTDTKSGATQTYRTPGGPPFAPIQDTNAFATCP